MAGDRDGPPPSEELSWLQGIPRKMSLSHLILSPRHPCRLQGRSRKRARVVMESNPSTPVVASKAISRSRSGERPSPAPPLHLTPKQRRRLDKTIEVSLSEGLVKLRQRWARDVVGLRVRREFGRDWYEGTVTQVWVSSEEKQPQAHIVYDDGDEEDVDLGNVKGMLVEAGGGGRRLHCP